MSSQRNKVFEVCVMRASERGAKLFEAEGEGRGWAVRGGATRASAEGLRGVVPCFLVARRPVQSSSTNRCATSSRFRVHSPQSTFHSSHSTTYCNTLMLDCHAILIEHVPPRRFVSSWVAQWILATMPPLSSFNPESETPQHSQMWRLHSPVAFSPNSFIWNLGSSATIA
jgi:hypothetical protein